MNLFTASRLASDDFAVTQETDFPNTSMTTLTVEKAGTYKIAVRHPSWVTADYQVSVNGTPVNAAVTKGVASYVTIDRTWTEGD